jgi:tRNA1Val (adenine37-N6)-methyltransferase
MANPHFRFRQFTIRQERCSMKVCTDSCILGAWTAARLQDGLQVLDIGAGTGLLTLMLAQETTARFDAIELDRDAFEQAAANIAGSPWSDRINLLPGDVRNYPFQQTYDFIISNPPFFASDLRSPSAAKNQARHDESLTLEDLARLIPRLLKPGGAFSLLLPFRRTAYFEGMAAEQGFYPQEKLLIRQTPAHPPFRSVLLCSSAAKPAGVSEKELIIRNADGSETTELLALMKNFYISSGRRRM